MLKRIYRKYIKNKESEEKILFERYRNKKRFVEEEIVFKGIRLTIPDVVSFAYQVKEIFSDEVYRFQSTAESPVIYDCGANVGTSILYFKKNFLKAKIKAFEADEKIYGILKKNIGHLDNVELFHNAVWINDNELVFNSDDDINELTDRVRKSVIRYMTRHNLIDSIDAREMLRWEHNGGFSIDCKVRIDKDDRFGLEKLLRYCSRPPLSLTRLHKDEIARIFEVMPLICTRCGHPMKIISFITEKDAIGHILNHIGESANPPHPTISPPVEIFEQHSEYLN